MCVGMRNSSTLSPPPPPPPLPPQKYLSLPFHQDHLVLQAQAVGEFTSSSSSSSSISFLSSDTLGTLARTVGVEQFSTIAEDCVLLGVVSHQ